MSAPPGTVVRLAPYDWGISRHRLESPPAEGDILVTEGVRGAGTAYLILDARLMERSAVPGRYALTCRVMGPAASVEVGSARVLVIHWYPRSRRRR